MNEARFRCVTYLRTPRLHNQMRSRRVLLVEQYGSKHPVCSACIQLMRSAVHVPSASAHNAECRNSYVRRERERPFSGRSHVERRNLRFDLRPEIFEANEITVGNIEDLVFNGFVAHGP